MKHGENGWTIGDGQQFDNLDMQDYEDSQSLYDILEQEIVPLYYDRNGKNLPTGWIQVMKHAIASITPRFSTARMVRDYALEAYLPAAGRGGAKTSGAVEQW